MTDKPDTWHGRRLYLGAWITKDEHLEFLEVALRQGRNPTEFLRRLIQTVIKNAKAK